MQMVRICVCHEYADVRHMDMFSLCNFLSFPFRSDFWWNRIFEPYHPALSSVTTTYATL